ncbi:motility associated factor glycosyltransferase family protein [Clostridium botulinum]|uniref:motility associated factor glycosyltransferase family protein n=1 Tax=Clostridium sp. LCP25S3_F10 TaxID=3438750 RepID=UPI002A68EFEE|nr:motility associated factor glycosyltransferase family protein [Clostridium botulinum]
MAIYEKNLNFLKDNNPLLYKTVVEDSPLQKIDLEEIDDQDNYIIKSNESKCFMHSIYNIENETKMMLNNVENNVNTIILFGLGNGYTLNYIIKKYENLYDIVVIEPSLDVFKMYLENHDFTNFFKHKSKKNLYMTFIVNESEDFVVDEIAFEMMNSKNAAMIFHVSYCSVFNSYYNNMMINLSKQLKVNTGSIVTLAYQWQLWLFNSIKNLRVRDIIPIENIKDIFKEKTVVIVSAGPSLNKNIHLIEKLKEKSIILAVGSAIKVLESKGIVPHFRVALDAFPTEKKVVVDEINTSSSILMFSNQLYYGILPEYHGGKTRYIVQSDYLGKYIYEKNNISYIEFGSGASVANGALNILCQLGCKRIIFMGQDLSYTEEGLHAKGVSTEKEDKEWSKKQEYTIVENIFGEKVYSITPYLQMKYTMEDTIKKYQGIEFLNATEGGLGIDGTENIKVQQVLDEKLKEEENLKIKEIQCIFDDEKIKKEYNEKIKNGLCIMKKELLEVSEIQNEIIMFIRKIDKLKQKNGSLNRIENEIRYLETLEKRLEEIPVYKEVIVKALQADILSIQTGFRYKGSDREKIIESKEKIIINTIIKVKEYIELAYKLIEDKHSSIVFENEDKQ